MNKSRSNYKSVIRFISAVVAGAGFMFLFGRLVKSGGKENMTAKGYQHQTEKEQSEVPPALTTKSDDPTPAESPKKAEGDRHKTIDTWRFVVELVTLVLFIAYVHFTYNQMAATQGQLAEMQRQRIADQRAWVGISGANLVYRTHNGSDFSLKVTVDLANSGKTPAKIESVKLLINVGKTPYFEGVFQGFTLAPNAYSAVPVPFTTNWPFATGVASNLWNDWKQEHSLTATVLYRVFDDLKQTKIPFSIKANRSSIGGSVTYDLSIAGQGEME